MDNYFTTVTLLGLKDQNLPPFKEARMKRYNSIRKMIDLIETASRTCPQPPVDAIILNSNDPEWDDDMTYPSITYPRLAWHAMGLAMNLWVYAYNYNIYTYNIRLRTVRYLFPITQSLLFGWLYWDYKTQLLKVNLFDEYLSLRAKELVNDYEFLLEHDDLKKFVWWSEDFKETMMRCHRQANNHDSSDFKDSEIILQDFIARYTNPNEKIPLPWDKTCDIL
jgi:hypothetical protein